MPCNSDAPLECHDITDLDVRALLVRWDRDADPVRLGAVGTAQRPANLPGIDASIAIEDQETDPPLQLGPGELRVERCVLREGVTAGDRSSISIHEPTAQYGSPPVDGDAHSPCVRRWTERAEIYGRGEPDRMGGDLDRERYAAGHMLELGPGSVEPNRCRSGREVIRGEEARAGRTSPRFAARVHDIDLNVA